MYRGEDFHEERVGARILPYLAIYQHRVARGGAHRRRMDFEPLARGQCEELEQPHRIGAEEIVGGGSQTAAVEHEAAEPFRLATDRRQSEAEALLGQLLVKLRKKDAGQI